MKRQVLVYVLVFVFILTLRVSGTTTTGVEETHSQGLYWGFEEGDVFYFRIEYRDENESWDYSLYATAPELEAIPDPLTSYIPRINLQHSTQTLHSSSAVPIGNWSLLSATIGNTIGRHILHETETKWGYEYNRTGAHYGTDIFIYSKEDGVLLNHTFEGYSLSMRWIIWSMIRVEAPVLQMVLLGISFVAIPGILIIIWKKKMWGN
ncbi:MAG: hypothetical protein ACFFCT_13085 [Candidatus Odinarchaeota archaeon]